MENYYLTEQEIVDRVDLFFEVINSIAEEFYPELNENFEDISDEYYCIFEAIVDYFVQVIDFDDEFLYEDISNTLAELYLTETVGDVISKFSSHTRKEKEANRAAREYKNVAKSVPSSTKGYKGWYNAHKKDVAEKLAKREGSKETYHLRKRAELATKIDRAIRNPFSTTIKIAKGATKALAKGIGKVLTTKIKQKRTPFEDRKYVRRMPRIRAIKTTKPIIKKK